jgi:ATPases involved in chromosome partitioning
VGFFDGLKRDAKQTQAVEEVETPQIQEQEKVVEEFREADPEDIEVIVRETEAYEVSDAPVVPLKTYKDKAPVKHVVGHTKIIAIINQKGGVGKSTTAINLGAALGEMGKQVLLVDLDPQGNCSSGLGVEKSLIQQCIYDVLLNDTPIVDVIIPDIAEGLDIAPATINLAGAEVELVSEMARENRLKEAVGSMRGKYDFILIDCPPSLGLLTVNALVAADKLLIPIQCEFYALEGVTKLLESMKRVKSRLNPTLDIYGILLTMYDSRTTLSKQVVDEVREYFGRLVFSTPIPRTVKLSEAPSFGQPITQYDPKGRGSLSYIELAKEVVDRG